VHAEGGKIAMQILHFGRYAYHPSWWRPARCRRRSALPPHALTARRSSRPSRTSPLRRAGPKAGYDGVEIMGSEGYLINEFIAARTNQRDDEWGGSYENRMRFPLEIVRRTRERWGRTSSSSSACRCSTWSKAAPRWTK
jgi:2,4-dienoyl-CoA reductase (NADPH2)